jgi:hypothetical protein
MSSPKTTVRSGANVNKAVKKALEQLAPNPRGRAQRDAKAAINTLKASRDALAKKLNDRADKRREETRSSQEDAIREANEQLAAARQFYDQYKDVHAPGFDELRDATLRAGEEWAKNVGGMYGPLDDKADRIDSLFLTWVDTLVCGAIDSTREPKAAERVEAVLHWGVDIGLIVGGTFASVAHPAAILAAAKGVQQLLKKLRENPRTAADADEARLVEATEIINAVNGIVVAAV